jgi:hypothetical protein
VDGQLLKTNEYEHHHRRLEDVKTWGENQIAVLTKKKVSIYMNFGKRQQISSSLIRLA